MKKRDRFTAAAIARACRGELVAGNWKKRASAICADSRAIEAGQAFLALVGDKYDAHDFVPDVARAGASIVIVSRVDQSWRLPGHVAVVAVPDTGRALMDLAAWHRARLKGTVVSVTGSCGKSTVKTMLAAVLARSGACSAAPKSFNNRIGVSLTLLAADVEDRFVVLEMGTNHFGEIDELVRMARPHAGVITCIGDCHLEHLGNRRGVREAKAEMVPHIARDGLLALNADDPLCMSLAPRFDGQVRTFGMTRPADVHPINARREAGCMVFELWGRTMRLPFTGHHNVMNAAAALAVAGWAGVPLDEARAALAEVKLPELRQQVRQIRGVTLVEDCYNSNPTAMRAALRTFVDEPVSGRRVVVCGDMLELGEQAPQLHIRVGRALALAGIDVLVAVGEMSAFLLEGWNAVAGANQVGWRVPTPEEAWRPLWDSVKPGDSVLIKGSHGMRMERIGQWIAEYVDAQKKSAA